MIVSKDTMDSGNGAEAVLYQPDNSIHIEVLVEGESLLWYTGRMSRSVFTTNLAFFLFPVHTSSEIMFTFAADFGARGRQSVCYG